MAAEGRPAVHNIVYVKLGDREWLPRDLSGGLGGSGDSRWPLDLATGVWRSFRVTVLRSCPLGSGTARCLVDGSLRIVLSDYARMFVVRTSEFGSVVLNSI